MLCLFFLLSFFVSSNAAIYRFNADLAPNPGDMYKRFSMYNIADAPDNKLNKAFLEIDLDVTMANADKYDPAKMDKKTVELLILHQDLFETIGVVTKEDDVEMRHRCCTENWMATKPGCSQPNLLILPFLNRTAVDKSSSSSFKPGADGSHLLRPVSESGSKYPLSYAISDLYFYAKGNFDEKMQLKMGLHLDVVKTGNYYVFVSSCDIQMGESFLSVTGPVISENAYGYLPAEYYGFLPFYLGMTVVYVLIVVLWGIFLFLNRSSILPVQWYITAVLVLSGIEMLAWYFDYVYYNNEGERESIAFIVAMISSVIRRAVSRMLVIAVAMGVGIVQAELTLATKRRVYIFGFLYLIFDGAYEIVTERSHSGEIDMHSATQMWVTFPVSALDAFCFWWVFISLATILSNLQLKQEIYKLELYRNISRILGVSLIVSSAFAMYQMKFIASKQLENASSWPYGWFIDGGFWNIQYTFLLIGVMFLLKPSPNAANYAYSQQIQTEEHADHADSDDIQMAEIPMPLEEDDEEELNAETTPQQHIIADEYGADDNEHQAVTRVNLKSDF